MFCTRLANGGLFPTGDPIVPFVISPRFECLNKRTHTHTHIHMALVGYFIVFSFVTKPGQTLEFLLWGTIVPLIFLEGYYCSIVASTPQPMAYASTHMYTVHMALAGYFIVFSFVTKPGQTLEFLLWGTIVPLNSLVGYHCSIVASTPQPTVYASTHTHGGSQSQHTTHQW